ncbi:hypothetical protein [Antribacter gilvus]|uniref:hypothetical protein n=1 Tax=Antribacter gilvus TaxID=2304675 RepID=UPI000F79A6CD|nr:hypothetical protein [Antribacter gilvus]
MSIVQDTGAVSSVAGAVLVPVTDGAGRPVVSATFVLARPPRPDERLGPLVVRGVLAVELALTLPERSPLVATTTFQVVREGEVLGERTVSGPFAHGAVDAVVTGPLAAELLDGILGGPTGIGLRAEACTAVPPGGRSAGHTATAGMDLLSRAISREPEAYVHLVCEDGGALHDVLPVRRSAPARGAGARRLPRVARGKEVMSLSAALGRPTASVTPLSAAAHLGAVVTPVLVTEALGLPPRLRTGPDVVDPAAPVWPDLSRAGHLWYAPALTVMTPDPAAGHEGAPFGFTVATEPGHSLDGVPALGATVDVTLVAGPSPETVAAAKAAGGTLHAVTLTAPLVQLEIPFRDEGGVTRVERIPATSTDATEVTEGTVVRARFRLLDAWARLAYGALSTPGFQTSPAVVSLTGTFDGWRQRTTQPVLGTANLWAIDAPAVTVRRPRTGARAARRGPAGRAPGASLALAILPPAVLAGSVGPAWQIRPDLLDRLTRRERERARLTVRRTVEASFPCATLGELYREVADDGTTRAVGCRPALQLGQTEHRTYEPLPVAAALGHAQVLRSLRSPGRFLVVPERYGVGRFAADDDRPYRPRLLVHSTIDTDDLSQVRCVIAAGLEPDLPPSVRSAILAELREHHPDPVLELPPSAGVEPAVRWAVPSETDVVELATADGYEVTVSCGIALFLALRSLLERGGVVGVATLELPGGLLVSSRLVLAAGSITGPYDGGVVEQTAGPGTVTLTNRAGVGVAVSGLARDGAVVAPVSAVLVPGGTVEVAVPDAGPFDVEYRCDTGREAFDEIPAYIDDLEVGITFVATEAALAGVAGLQVSTSFIGRDDPDDLELTATTPQARRDYVLPLTTFAGDPTLVLRVTAVGTDGTRTTSDPVTWPIRARGTVVPIGPALPAGT